MKKEKAGRMERGEELAAEDMLFLDILDYKGMKKVGSFGDTSGLEKGSSERPNKEFNELFGDELK